MGSECHLKNSSVPPRLLSGIIVSMPSSYRRMCPLYHEYVRTRNPNSCSCSQNSTPSKARYAAYDSTCIAWTVQVKVAVAPTRCLRWLGVDTCIQENIWGVSLGGTGRDGPIGRRRSSSTRGDKAHFLSIHPSIKCRHMHRRTHNYAVRFRRRLDYKSSRPSVKGTIGP